jgi:peroxiredoxin family protein
MKRFLNFASSWSSAPAARMEFTVSSMAAVTVIASVALATGVNFEQYCTFNGANDLAKVNRFLRYQAQNGWELVAVGGRNATVYCFKASTAPGTGG